MSATVPRLEGEPVPSPPSPGCDASVVQLGSMPPEGNPGLGPIWPIGKRVGSRGVPTLRPPDTAWQFVPSTRPISEHLEEFTPELRIAFPGKFNNLEAMLPDGANASKAAVSPH